MLNDSLFVSGVLHERTVKLADGSEHLMHFKELPAVKFRAFHAAERSTDEEVRAGSMARLIADSICEPDGSHSLTYERALLLKPAAAGAIINEILAVNGFGAGEKKGSESETMTGSGTS